MKMIILSPLIITMVCLFVTCEADNDLLEEAELLARSGSCIPCNEDFDGLLAAIDRDGLEANTDPYGDEEPMVVPATSSEICKEVVMTGIYRSKRVNDVCGVNILNGTDHAIEYQNLVLRWTLLNFHCLVNETWLMEFKSRSRKTFSYGRNLGTVPPIGPDPPYIDGEWEDTLELKGNLYQDLDGSKTHLHSTYIDYDLFKDLDMDCGNDDYLEEKCNDLSHANDFRDEIVGLIEVATSLFFNQEVAKKRDELKQFKCRKDP